MGSNYAPHELSETVAVLTKAVESNERQIHEVAQTSAQGIKDLSILIEKQGAQHNTRLETLAESFQASQKPNYMLWVAVMAILFTLTGAAWKITDSQTQLTMSPISSRVSVAEKSIDETKRDVAINREALASITTQQEVVKTKLVETETQFRASDQARNVQFAEQQRMNNIMFQLAQKKPIIDYPVYPYFFPKTAADDHQQ